MTVIDQVGVLSFGVGNTGSLRRALYRTGASVKLVTSPDDISDCDRLVLPGVGAFSAAMKALQAEGWEDAIINYVALGRPLMGICLGMQILMEYGEEGGFLQGLGLIAGATKPLAAHGVLKLPHIGWNSIRPLKDHVILKGVRPEVDYYFAHSYVVSPEESETIVAETMHGIPFPSVIGRDNLLGVQFHPEKSPPMGYRILRNFIEWSP